MAAASWWLVVGTRTGAGRDDVYRGCFVAVAADGAPAEAARAVFEPAAAAVVPVLDDPPSLMTERADDDLWSLPWEPDRSSLAERVPCTVLT